MHEGAVSSSSVTAAAPFLGWKQPEQHQVGFAGIGDMVLPPSPLRGYRCYSVVHVNSVTAQKTASVLLFGGF